MNRHRCSGHCALFLVWPAWRKRNRRTRRQQFCGGTPPIGRGIGVALAQSQQQPLVQFRASLTDVNQTEILIIQVVNALMIAKIYYARFTAGVDLAFVCPKRRSRVAKQSVVLNEHLSHHNSW